MFESTTRKVLLGMQYFVKILDLYLIYVVSFACHVERNYVTTRS